MSCEGNRHRFFSALEARFPGLDAQRLEKLYQAARNAPAQDSDDVLDAKTRHLFDDMRALDIKPPTHSPDGLPKKAARKGYAAVFDALRAAAHAPFYTPQDLGRDRAYDLVDIFGVNAYHFLDGNRKNAAGYLYNGGIETADGNRASVYLDDFRKIAQNDRLSPDDITGVQDFMQTVDAAYRLGEQMPDGFDRYGLDAQGVNEFGLNLYGLPADPDALNALEQDGRLEKLVRISNALRYHEAGYVRPRTAKVDLEGYTELGWRVRRDLVENPLYDLRDRFGWNPAGFRHGRTFTGYDEQGLDAQGRSAPRRKGYDRFGYERKTGLTAPDAQGRRYNLIGWIYDPQTDTCYNPNRPQQRMPHQGSFRYSRKLGKVVLNRSYVPTADEMLERIKNPRIILAEHAAGGPPPVMYQITTDSPDLFEKKYDRLASPHDINTRRATFLALSSPALRYLRSAARAQHNPDAAFLGVRLRCPQCGQFTGARPHVCPHYHGRQVVVLTDGSVIAVDARPSYAYQKAVQITGEDIGASYTYLSSVYATLHDLEMDFRLSFKTSGEIKPYSLQYLSHSDLDILKAVLAQGNVLKIQPEQAPWHLAHGAGGRVTLNDLLVTHPARLEWLEAPNSPLGEAYDPDFDGHFPAGFHHQSGLTRDGYTFQGIHYLTARRKTDGLRISDIARNKRMKDEMDKLSEQAAKQGLTLKDIYARTYSHIASAMAGAPRRVRVEDKGGPRNDMFWTDMRGQINAEMRPLSRTPYNSVVNNLLAMKAGIYHELGHEEDTPVGIFRRVVDIAEGREKVPGLPPEQAGIVAEIYNILEDGRMERQQARRRRGVAAILAADARINPRWDETVGEDIPPQHQVFGMMLYRSLPFFRVRQEVYEQAPPRVRKLFDEVRPLIDRAMRSPEETFAASIEIARRLVQDDHMQQFARQMTQQQGAGGKWALMPADSSSQDGGASEGQGYQGALIISALPRPGSGNQADQTLTIPPPGWGRAQDDPQQGTGRQPGRAQDDPHQGTGRQPGRAQDDPQQGTGRQPGRAQDDPQQGSGRQSGSDGRPVSLTPEVDELFFQSLSGAAREDDLLNAALDSLIHDMETGARFLREPAGKQMLRPNGYGRVFTFTNPVTNREVTTLDLSEYADMDPEAAQQLPEMKEAARQEGARLARRLETLREKIRQKQRFQTSGTPDRRRYKRAVAGSKTVYRQERLQDISSLAVGIQLDMSGSMHTDIISGRLAAVSMTIQNALNRLDAESFIMGFGSYTAVLKSLGDETLSDRAIHFMMRYAIGATSAADAVTLSGLTFKETRSRNKIHFMLTDGELDDAEKTRAGLQALRQSGVMPMGIFLGVDPPEDQMNDVFGEGNWVAISRLSDLSDVVAKRIERLYRRILATR